MPRQQLRLHFASFSFRPAYFCTCYNSEAFGQAMECIPSAGFADIVISCLLLPFQWIYRWNSSESGRRSLSTPLPKFYSFSRKARIMRARIWKAIFFCYAIVNLTPTALSSSAAFGKFTNLSTLIDEGDYVAGQHIEHFSESDFISYTVTCDRVPIADQNIIWNQIHHLQVHKTVKIPLWADARTSRQWQEQSFFSTLQRQFSNLVQWAAPLKIE